MFIFIIDLLILPIFIINSFMWKVILLQVMLNGAIIIRHRHLIKRQKLTRNEINTTPVYCPAIWHRMQFTEAIGTLWAAQLTIHHDLTHSNPLIYSYRNSDTTPYYNPLATDNYLPSYDNEQQRKIYCFQSPLYSTTWSPPPNDGGSRPGSLSNTPVHSGGGSVRAENEDAYSSSRHVYPPYTDDFSDSGKLSSRSVDNDYASPNSPQLNHVYSEAVMSDEKDDSRSPKLNVDYADQVVLAEQMGIASVATTPEQNGPNSNHSSNHHEDEDCGGGGSGEVRDELPDS